jgi:hypothetical protein
VSHGLEPDGTHEVVEIIEPALIEAIELRSLLPADTGIAANGERRPVDARENERRAFAGQMRHLLKRD